MTLRLRQPLSAALLLLLAAIASRVVFLALTAAFGVQLAPDQDLARMLCRWDCGWYANITRHGYFEGGFNPDTGEARWAFFPLFPMLARLTSTVTGLQEIAAGAALSNVLFCLTPSAAYLAYRRMLGARDAAFLAALMIVTPYALYSSVNYTEATYGLLLIAMVWAAFERRWILAGLIGAALSATRSVGVFGFLIILVSAIQTLGFRTLVTEALGMLKARIPDEETLRVFLGVMLAPLGCFIYILYLHRHVGDGFAFANVQIAWDREWRNPVANLLTGLTHPDYPLEWLIAWATVLGVLLTGVLAAKRRYAEALLLGLTIFLPLSQLLQSVHRYALAPFMPYLAIALIMPANRVLRAGLLAAMALLNIVYVSGWLIQARWIT